MKKFGFGHGVIVVFCIMMVWNAAFAAAAPEESGERTITPIALEQKGNETSAQESLQKSCLEATVQAIQLEIARHEGWIAFRTQQGDKASAAKLQESLLALQEDLAKYRAMAAKDFIMPEKSVAIANLEPGMKLDALLYVDGMTKSGPWYHLAGITGDGYSQVKTMARYDVVFYKVYSRSYWGMDSAYVYVAEIGQRDSAILGGKSLPWEGDALSTAGKRIQGEVFLAKNNGIFESPTERLVPWQEYEVYLLKDSTPGAPGELLFKANASVFDITLSPEQLNEYAYIEFVSPRGSKTMRLDEITADKMKILLTPAMVVKKPAIYLYPEQETKVTIIHEFKGRLLNTYPQYTDKWQVIAQRDGSLVNLQDRREYKYLFWDGAYAFPPEHYQFTTGFYVAKEDYVSFLQRKLATIGLNDNEINDFIVYWLPAMSNYQQCFVYFRINDNIDGSSILRTTPEPETTLRVFMEFSSVEKLEPGAKLPEQSLARVVRKGFTLVEWGGAEIGKGTLE